MVLTRRTHSLYILLLAVTKGYFQRLSEPIGTEGNCFNGIVKGNCSLPTERAFVTNVNAGAKVSIPNIHNCTPYWTNAIAEECCQRENNDCYGPYQPVATDPYAFHRDCIGKYQCSPRAAARMDTSYHSHCNHSSYPLQTSYMDIEFLCIDVSKIVSINGDPKTNDGQGSTLYLWSGDTTYQPLTSTDHQCSIETDCDDTISVISVDFRFATNDANMTCIPEKHLNITEDGLSKQFDCSDNNNFTIKTLYNSVSNYIILSLENDVGDGHLWLAFESTANGNLTIDCKSPKRRKICEETTTMEDTTTESKTTTYEMTTDDSTTKAAILTSTEEMANSTNSSTVKSPSTLKSTNYLPIILGTLIVLIAAIIIIGFIVYWKRCRRKRQNDQPDNPEQNAPISSGNNLPNVPPTRQIHLVSRNQVGTTTNNDQLHFKHDNGRLISLMNNALFNQDENTTTTKSVHSPLPPIYSTTAENENEKQTESSKKKKKNVIGEIRDESVNETANTDKKKKTKKRKNINNDFFDENEEGGANQKQKKKKKKRKKDINDISAENKEEEDDQEQEKKKKKKKKKKKQKKKERHDDVDNDDQIETMDKDPNNVNTDLGNYNVYEETEEGKHKKRKKKRKSTKVKLNDIEGEEISHGETNEGISDLNDYSP